MDYKKLLFKYLSHLQQVEDSTFIELINTPFSPKVLFTEEEITELREMFEEIIREKRSCSK